MQWQEFWLILGGFLLGLVISTLWEWFYFRQQRVEWHDAEVERLEAELRQRDEWIRVQQQANVIHTRTETTTEQQTVADSAMADSATPPPAPAASAYAASLDYQSPPVFLGNEEAEALRGDAFRSAPLISPYDLPRGAQEDAAREASGIEINVDVSNPDTATADAGPLPATSIYAPGVGIQPKAAPDESPLESPSSDLPLGTHVSIPIGDEEDADTDPGQVTDSPDDVAQAALAAGLVASRARAEQDAGDAFVDDDAATESVEPGDRLAVIINEDADDAVTVVLDAEGATGALDDEVTAPPVETESVEAGDHVTAIVNEDADDTATVVLDAEGATAAFKDEDVASSAAIESVEAGDRVTVIVNEDADATVVLDAEDATAAFKDEDVASSAATESVEPGDRVTVIVNEDADDTATVVLDAEGATAAFKDEDVASSAATESVEPGDRVTVIVNEDADDTATVVLDAEGVTAAFEDEDVASSAAAESVEPGDHITLVLDDNESSTVDVAAEEKVSVPVADVVDLAPPVEREGFEAGDRVTIVLDDDDEGGSSTVVLDAEDDEGAHEVDDGEDRASVVTEDLEAGDRVTIVLDVDDAGGSSTVSIGAEDVDGAPEADEERAAPPIGTEEFEPGNAAAAAEDVGADTSARAVVLDAEYVASGLDAALGDDGESAGELADPAVAEPDAPAPGDRVSIQLDAEGDVATVDPAYAPDTEDENAGGAFEPVGEEDERAPERLGFDTPAEDNEDVAAHVPGVTIIVESAQPVVIDADQIGEEPEIGEYAFVPSVQEEAAAMAAWVESALLAARAEKARKEAAAEEPDDEAGAAGERDSEDTDMRGSVVILRDEDAPDAPKAAKETAAMAAWAVHDEGPEAADDGLLAEEDAGSEPSDDVDLTELTARLANATDQSTAGVYLELQEGLESLRATAADDLIEEDSLLIDPMQIELEEASATQIDEVIEQFRTEDGADTFGSSRLAMVNPDPAEPADDEHPDNLALIDGIGPTYRQRLYDHGVFTFYQVSLLDATELEEITQAIAAANPAAWRKDANELAAAYGRDGAVYAGPMPAELDAINGIDRDLAQWLYMAGIHTFADLAARRPSELQALLAEGVNWREADAAKWVKRAAVLAKRQEASSA